MALLQDAGYVMVGKANLHEFAWGVTSRNRAYGAVVNSARPDRIPGGSSGGNASALAAGLCALGLGTDTGASIRLPAAACGVAGFKPAFGSVPADGLWPLAPSFDHVGPHGALGRRLRARVRRAARRAAPAGATLRRCASGSSCAADTAPTTEAFLEGASLPAAPDLVRLHLAECAEVHREIFAEHSAAYDDDLQAKMAVGLAVTPRGARAARGPAARMASRVRRGLPLGRARLARVPGRAASLRRPRDDRADRPHDRLHAPGQLARAGPLP